MSSGVTVKGFVISRILDKVKDKLSEEDFQALQDRLQVLPAAHEHAKQEVRPQVVDEPTTPEDQHTAKPARARGRGESRVRTDLAGPPGQDQYIQGAEPKAGDLAAQQNADVGDRVVLLLER